MGHDNHKHEVSEKKAHNDESYDSAKKIVTDGQNSKDNQKVIEQKKNNPEANKAVKNLFGEVSIDAKPAAQIRTPEEIKKINDLAKDISDSALMINPKTEKDELQKRMSELNPDERKAVFDTVNQKYGDNEQVSDETKAKHRELYGPDATIYRDHSTTLALELLETSENKEPRHPIENMKSLAGVMDQETITAVRRNEEKKAGYDDTLLDHFHYSIAQYFNWSIGPAQMQTKHIDQLKADPRYAEQLKDADPYTRKGADQLVAAYFAREAERLNNGEYAAGKTGRPRDDEPKDGRRFEALQQRWNEAKNACNPDEMRKILVETYNSGNGSRQVAEVESIRTGYSRDPQQTASLSARLEPASLIIPPLDSKAAA